MTLREVIEQLEEQDLDATIYFLAVAVALEAALVSEAGARFERVLHYAMNDAFLFDE